MTRFHMPRPRWARPATDAFERALHHGLHGTTSPQETPPGPIVDNGEFAGPIDGWLPTHTWLARHGMGEEVES